MNQELKNLLLKHDWYFDYSDSAKVAARGMEEKKKIVAMIHGLRLTEQEKAEILELIPPDLRGAWRVHL